MNMLKEWLLKYRDRFDENFPIFMLRGTPEDEVIEIIKKCLDQNNPFIVDFDTDPSIDY